MTPIRIFFTRHARQRWTERGPRGLLGLPVRIEDAFRESEFRGQHNGSLYWYQAHYDIWFCGRPDRQGLTICTCRRYVLDGPDERQPQPAAATVA